MKNLSQFMQTIQEGEEEVYSLYYDDGTMYTYYTSEEEANKEAEKLNKENSDFKVTVKKEKKSEIEKPVTEGTSDNKLWDQLSKLKEEIGSDKLVDEICQSMSDDEMKRTISFIARNYEIHL